MADDLENKTDSRDWEPGDCPECGGLGCFISHSDYPTTTCGVCNGTGYLPESHPQEPMTWQGWTMLGGLAVDTGYLLYSCFFS